NQTSIGLWEVATGRLVTSRPGHGTAVNAVAFSQNGRKVVSTSPAGDARLWDATTGRQIHTFQGDWASFVVPSADGARRLALSGNNQISLWDVAAGKRLQRRQVKKNSSNRSAPYIYQLALSADGRLLTSISNDDSSPVTVQRVDGGAEGPLPKPLKRQFSRLFCPSLSPDGRLMADIEGDKVHLRDTASAALLRTLHTGPLQAGEYLDRPLVFSADGRVVACASPRFVEPEPGHKVCRNKIRLWEVATGELLGVMPVP